MASNETTKPAGRPSEVQTRAASPSTADADVLRRGASVGRYTIMSVLGRGGNGTVYLALDPELDRKVAIKVLSPGAGSVELLHEGRVAGSMAHPNVVRIFDVGDFGSDVFIAMEHLDGSTLADWLTQEHSRAQVMSAMIDAGRGLSAAHQAGLVHGDFKPKNVMVTTDGRVVVLDFGLGRSIEHDGSDEMGPASLAGTPPYMAPELFALEPATPASDQFAYCIALHEALLGQHPFSLASLQSGRLEAPTIPRSIPRSTRVAMLRGLRADPAERFESMESLLAELVPRPPALRRFGFVAVTVGTLAATWATSSQRDDPLCEPARSPMHEVWHDEARATLREVATPDAADALAARLDDFTGRWQAQWVDACRARHIEHTESPELFDRRTLCLDRGRASLAAVLEAADSDQAIRRAPLVVSELPNPERCGDAEALLSTLALPDDPAKRAELGRLERDVARAQAMARFSTQREGITATLPNLLRRGQALGSNRTIARIHFAEATAMLDEERYDMADAAYRRACHHAELAHDDTYAARVATFLVYLEGLRGHADRAEIWADYCRTKLGRVPSDQTELRLGLMASEAVVARQAGNDGAAIELLEQALAEHETVEHANVVVKGDMLASLGAAYRVAGRHDEALEAAEQALELRRTMLGSRHPLVGESHYNIAVLYLDAKDFDQARAHLEESRALLDNSRAGARRTLAIANMLGALLAEAGEFEQAQGVLRTGIEDARARSPEPIYELNPPMVNLARMLMMNERPEEARELLAEAITIGEATRGRDYAPMQGDYELLARASMAAHHPDEAVAALRRARALASAGEDRTRIDQLIASINREQTTDPPP